MLTGASSALNSTPSKSGWLPSIFLQAGNWCRRATSSPNACSPPSMPCSSICSPQSPARITRTAAAAKLKGSPKPKPKAQIGVALRTLAVTLASLQCSGPRRHGLPFRPHSVAAERQSPRSPSASQSRPSCRGEEDRDQTSPPTSPHFDPISSATYVNITEQPLLQHHTTLRIGQGNR